MAFITTLLLAVAVVPAGDSPAGEAADDIEQLAVRARRAIRHGHVAYDVKAEINDPGNKLDTSYRIEIWFDETRCRVDKRFLVPETKTRVVECRGCGPERMSLEWNDVDGRTVVPYLGRRGVDANVPPENLLFDARAVGMHGSQIVHPTCKLTGLLTNPDRSHRRVSDFIEAGKKLKRLEFTQGSSRNTYEIVLDPDFDCNPVRIACRIATGSNLASVTIRSELSRYGKSSACYPKKVVSEEIGKDGTILRRISATVASADFDSPPEEAAFTLKGIGLPAGIPVRMADRSPAKFDGEKLIVGDAAVGAARKPEKPRPLASPSGHTYVYIASAGIFASMSLVAGYFAFRRKARLR